jgi:hypothetical protein
MGCYSPKGVVGCQEDPLIHHVQECFCCQILTVEDIHRNPEKLELRDTRQYTIRGWILRVDSRYSHILQLQIRQCVIPADAVLGHSVDRMMHKYCLALVLLGAWVYGSKVQQSLLVQNNLNAQQGFDVVVAVVDGD